MPVPRALSPSTNPAGLLAAGAAAYALGVALYNLTSHHTAISTPVLIAGLAAVGYLINWFRATPLADPRDGAGRPLVPLSTPPGAKGTYTSCSNVAVVRHSSQPVADPGSPGARGA